MTIQTPSPLIPPEVHLGAKRAFIRTAYQSLATGLLVPGGLTVAFTGDWVLAGLIALGGLILTAVINGLQAYFSWISKGIPEDYRVAAEVVTNPVLDVADGEDDSPGRHAAND